MFSIGLMPNLLSISLKGIYRKFLGLIILLPENMTDEQKIRYGIEVTKKPRQPKRYMDKHCKPCGAQLVLGSHKCEYCGTEHFAQSPTSPQEDDLMEKMKMAQELGMHHEAKMYAHQAMLLREFHKKAINYI
jgi:hypothetical protein